MNLASTLSTNDDWWNTLAVDGVDTGLTDAGHYQQIIWDSTGVSGGSHTLTAMAHQINTGAVTATAYASVVVNNTGPTATGFSINVDSAAHAQFGLYFPATYVFGIPSGASGLTAQYRYNTSNAWTSLPTKTSANFFNGIAAGRFDYTNNLAYVSVPFSSSSDTIYVKIINGAQQPVLINYQGIPPYYDNRKAAVTVDFDDIYTEYLSDAIKAIFRTSAKHLHVTAAVVTRYMDPSSWPTVQSWVNSGLVEAASHTQTHACNDADYQAGGGYTVEISGSRDDLLSNLALPHLYIPSFIQPCGFSDDAVYAAVAGAGYLVSRGTNTPVNNFGPWLDYGFYDSELTADTDSWPSYTTYPNPGGTARLLSSWNAMFDGVYASGAMYHILDHPWQKRWSSGGYLDQHAAYIANRNDVWYATVGELYLYHYLQERAKVSVMAQ